MSGHLEALAESVSALVQQPVAAAAAELAGLQQRHTQLTSSAQRQLCDSLQTYARFVPKRDTESRRFEINTDVYSARRAWHHGMLEYCHELNRLLAPSR